MSAAAITSAMLNVALAKVAGGLGDELDAVLAAANGAPHPGSIPPTKPVADSGIAADAERAKASPGLDAASAGETAAERELRVRLSKAVPELPPLPPPLAAAADPAVKPRVGPLAGHPEIPARGVFADLAESALHPRSILAPTLEDPGAALNQRLLDHINATQDHHARLTAALNAAPAGQRVKLLTPAPRAPTLAPASRIFHADKAPTPPRAAAAAIPRGRASGMVRALLGLGGLGVGTAAAIPAVQAISAPPAPPTPTSTTNPWAIAGGLAGLTGLGVGGYLLNQHFKKKRDAAKQLDEDAEVV